MRNLPLSQRATAFAEGLLLSTALLGGLPSQAADPTTDRAAHAMRSESWRKFVASVESLHIEVPEIAVLERACKVSVERTTSQDEAELLNTCLDAAVSALPVVGAYTAPARAEAQRMSNASAPFGSIGIEIGRRGRTTGPIHVVSPLANSPAERAGVLAGDDIYEIDGRDIIELPMDKAVLGFRGKPGSMVRLRIARGEEARMMTLDVKREIIRVSYARSHWVEPDALWVRISYFGDKASQDLARQLAHQHTVAQGRVPRVLVLDLRNCPGGSLDEVRQALSVFIPTETVVGWARARSETTPLRVQALRPLSPEEVAQADAVWRQVPLVVLVDENTASGAELFALALRQHRKAVLAGATTAGVVRIDHQVSLPNGARVAFPQSAMLDADKSSWLEKGLVPDLQVEGGLRAEYGTKNDAGLAAALRR